jgi:hypothetical protein
MLSAWDKMVVAKYAPGTIDAPYVAAMGLPPIPTGIFKVGAEFYEAAEGPGASILNLGSKRFTLITYVPALSNYYGSGVAGSFSAFTKLSGFTI